MKKQLVWIAAMLLFLPLSVSAARFGSGDSYTIGRGETVNENVYGAGGQVNIDGMINGDVHAAGGTVIVGGTITNDAVIAGGTVQINGTVNEDARLAGGTVLVNGSVLGETIIAGGTVVFSSSASSTGEVIVTGGQVTLDGSMNGAVRVFGGNVTIRGRVNGPLTVNAESIIVESTAVVTGLVTYSSPQEATIRSGAALQGGVTYHKTEPRQAPGRDAGKLIGAAWFASWLMALVFGAILYAIFRRPVTDIVRYAGMSAGKSALTGFIALVATPVALILMFITILGIPIAIVLSLLYVALMLIGGSIAGMFLGSLVAKLVQRVPEYRVSWVTVLGGITLMSVLSLIPVLGWVTRFAFFLVGFGALILWLWGRREQSAQPIA